MQIFPDKLQCYFRDPNGFITKSFYHDIINVFVTRTSNIFKQQQAKDNLRQKRQIHCTIL